jgi:glycosyltransferase involved in cell wall biosynthesis
MGGTGYRVAVVTLPVADICGYENLRYLLEQLEPLAANLYAVTGPCRFPGRRVEVCAIALWHTENQWGKMVRHLVVDLKICRHLLRIARRVDVVILFVGARSYLLAALLSRILGKKLVAFSFTTAGTIARIKKVTRQERVSSALAGLLERWVLTLAHQIAVQAPAVAAFSGLERYRRKIAVYGAKHIDFARFRPVKELGARPNAVLYVGSLIELKGVRRLLRAFPLVLARVPDARLNICGFGPLHRSLVAEARALGIADRIRLPGWIGSEEVPGYLNNARLLVLPSQSEGVPAIVQEAMACGTPVAATPVGGIPDLIVDRQTGYLIPDGTIEAIAATIIRALTDPDASKIAAAARQLVAARYSHAELVRQCRAGLERLGIK